METVVLHIKDKVFYVTKSRQLGLRQGDVCFNYDAWEPSSLMGNHSHIASLEDVEGWVGDVRSRRLRPAFAKIPVGEKRFKLLSNRAARLQKIANWLIKKAFPHAPIFNH